jgi:hypothetical protein
MPDLVTAARRELASHSDLTDLLGSDATYSTWIFRWRPYVIVEGTSSAAIVLSRRAAHAAPNTHNTMRFPRLQVEIFADELRNAAGNPTRAARAEDYCESVFDVMDKYLHRPDAKGFYWGAEGDDPGLRILSSWRLDELDVVDVPDGDGMVRGLVSYGVTLG